MGAASIAILPLDSLTLDNVAKETGAPNVTLCKSWDAADAVGAGWGREALYSYIGEAVSYIGNGGEVSEPYIDISYRPEQSAPGASSETSPSDHETPVRVIRPDIRDFGACGFDILVTFSKIRMRKFEEGGP